MPDRKAYRKKRQIADFNNKKVTIHRERNFHFLIIFASYIVSVLRYGYFAKIC